MPLNYCDYDALEHYESGAFSKQFQTDLSDRIEEVEKDTTLSKNDIDSFKDGQYITCRSTKPIVLYRLYGRYEKDGVVSGSALGGRSVSTEFAESLIDAKIRLALLPKWKKRNSL